VSLLLQPQLQLLEAADQRRRQMEIEDAKRKRYHQFLRAVSAHRDEFIKFHRYICLHIVPFENSSTVKHHQQFLCPVVTVY
jgi:hypothetical protein